MKISFIKSIYRKCVYTALASVLFAAVSCQFLEVEPKDVTRDKDFLQNYWDADFMMRGTYQALQPIVEHVFVLGEVRGDWVTPGTGADKDITELAEHRVTPSNKYTRWNPYYDLINRANYAVKNLPRVPKDSTYFNYKVMMQSIGEAKFLRGLAYFHLVRNFNDVPFTTESIDDISKVKYLAAIPSDDVLDSVEADLKEAYKYTDIQIFVLNTFDAGFRQSNEQTRLRATKATVCALQAQVYLWRNKYAEAKTVLKNMENIATSNNLYYTNVESFMAGPNWLSFFYTPVVFQEFLFDIAFSYVSREINPLMRITSNDPASGGQYMVAPSTAAIKAYNPSYPDIKKVNTTDEIHRGFGRSYAGSAPYYNRPGSAPVIWKFLALGSVTPATIDVPPTVRPPYESEALLRILRMGDVWLMWAETLNRLGDKAGAINYLNQLRRRGGMPNSTVTSSATTEVIEDAILKERGLELGFEGHRWYDLIRISKHRGSPQVLIDAVKRRAPVSMHARLDATLADSKNWYLPYNEEELRLNPNLTQKP